MPQMNPDRDPNDPQAAPDLTGRIGGVLLAVLFVALCILGAMMTGCSRKVYIPVEHTVYRTDTLRQTALKHDSIWVHDSVSLIQRGDTVFITKIQDRFRYVNLTDTIYQSRTDSIRVSEPYPVEVIKEVPRALKWWQKTLMWIGVAALVLCAVMTYRGLRKRLP